MKKILAAVLSIMLLVTSVSAAGIAPQAEGQNAALTRGEAVRLLYEAEGEPDISGQQPFTDATDECADALVWAYQQGIVAGIGGGLFAPNAFVTRQALAAMLYRSVGAPAVSGSELAAYEDEQRVSVWAHDALLWSVKTGVLPECGNSLIAPVGQVTKADVRIALQRMESLPDMVLLQQDLETLASVHRPIGSTGEQMASEYLRSRFLEMGYEVTLQSYTDQNGLTGTNVIATKNAKTDADILVFSAHHDCAPTAYGANDNASGVAALLAVAELLKDIPTDTELRFISFTDEENGKNGSRFYTESLSDAERSRMIGDIQLDMLGGLGTAGLSVCTMDGEANWLSELLIAQYPGAVLHAETASDHASFQLAEVPSILVMQDGRGYLYHSTADTADQIDLYSVAGAVRAVTDVGKEIASPQTSGFRETARAQADGYTYRQTRQNVIYFDSSLTDSEAYIGAAGTLVEQREVEGNGWKDVYETYQYSMRWFGGETPMNTYYVYRNGYLSNIEIRPEETGYTGEQVNALLRDMYGEPDSARTGRDGIYAEGWADEIYSKYITFKDSDPCVVTVGKYSVGISNVLANYPVQSRQATITDAEDALVWDYICSILPEQARMKIGEFRLFTDGYSNILAYTSPMSNEDQTVDNTRFTICIDYYDVYDENGVPRDWSKLTNTVLHEYGHVLLEDETQVDLSVGTGTHDPNGYIPGSFRKVFYDRFWKDLPASGVGDYNENPTNYVSRYGANYFHEDIADTFAVFVLGGEPEGNTVAEDKLRFFWDDPDMVALRMSIRESIGLL